MNFCGSKRTTRLAGSEHSRIDGERIQCALAGAGRGSVDGPGETHTKAGRKPSWATEKIIVRGFCGAKEQNPTPNAATNIQIVYIRVMQAKTCIYIFAANTRTYARGVCGRLAGNGRFSVDSAGPFQMQVSA
jgi:hypothetical protein